MRPVTLRGSERTDYKRCPTKWYWRWRMGLVPRNQTFGALNLGTWVHATLAQWYSTPKRRPQMLPEIMQVVATRAIELASGAGAPDYELEKANELHDLAEAMVTAYGVFYGRDRDVRVIRAEIPLEFEFTNDDGKLLATHRLKPDLLYRDPDRRIWLQETKTARTIRTEHLVIDDQARPYGAMAELALKRAGLLDAKEHLYGIMYNFLRKGYPDGRQTNKDGLALNKDGSVSKSQPAPLFKRHPTLMTRRAKLVTLNRLRDEAVEIAVLTHLARRRDFDVRRFGKTQHYSCAKYCDYFTMCALHEEGADISHMQRSAFVRRDPYLYDEDTTDDPISFEMG